MKNKIGLYIFTLSIFLSCQLHSIRENYWEDTAFTYFSREVKKEELRNRYRLELENGDSTKFFLVTISNKDILKQTKEHYIFLNFATQYYIKKKGYEGKYVSSIILHKFRYENVPLIESIDLLIVFSFIDSKKLLEKLIENKSNVIRKNMDPILFDKPFFDDFTLTEKCLQNNELKAMEIDSTNQTNIQELDIYQNQTSCIQTKLHLPPPHYIKQ